MFSVNSFDQVVFDVDRLVSRNVNRILACTDGRTVGQTDIRPDCYTNQIEARERGGRERETERERQRETETDRQTGETEERERLRETERGRERDRLGETERGRERLSEREREGRERD